MNDEDFSVIRVECPLLTDEFVSLTRNGRIDGTVLNVVLVVIRTATVAARVAVNN
jgi:hypothetical protein